MPYQRSAINRKPKLNAPEFSESQQRTVLGFLAEQMTVAQDTLEKWKAIAGKDKHMPIFANVILYWEHAIGYLKDLAQRVRGPQLHLLYLPDDKSIEVRETWEQELETLSTVEQSDKSAFSTQLTCPMMPTGNSVENTPSENSGS